MNRAIGAVVALTFVVAADAHAAPLDAGALAFSVDNPRILLGETKRAVITIVARDPAAHFPDLEELAAATPRVTASVGTIGEIVRAAPGLWTCEYFPPANGPPQVAVVVASLDASSVDAVGFVVVPLWGKGETVVHTKPGTAVTVRAGKQTFGPVKSDADGTAKVPLAIPPGVTNAVTHALDDVGNVAERTVDLGVPAFPRVAVLALDDVVVADGSNAARLVAVTVDGEGAPQAHAALSAKASAGSVEIGKELAAGLVPLLLRVKASGASTIDVDVSLNGVKGSARAHVNAFAGAVANAKIELSRNTIGDDDKDRVVEVTVHLLDLAGNPVPAQAAAIHVDAGRISSPKTDAAGAAHLRWVVPKIPEGTVGSATVSIRAGEKELATGVVALVPPQVAALHIDPVALVIADGENVVDIVVRASDAKGRALVPAAALDVDPAFGSLSKATLVSFAAGPALVARLTPRAVTTGTTIAVRATSGDVTSTLDVPVAAPPVPLLVSGGADVESNYGALVAVGVAAGAHARLVDALYGGVTVAALQSVVRPASIADHRAFPALVDVVYRPPLSPNVDLVIGLAGGPVLVDVVDKPAGPQLFEFAAAGQLVAGLGLTLGPVPLDVLLRAGTAVVVGTPVGTDGGVPLGATLEIAWRLAP